MARDTIELLNEILRCARDVVDYAAGSDFHVFLRIPAEDGKTYRAIKNALAELGEAIKGLPTEIKDRRPSIDWRGLSGLRDIVAHQYHRIEMEMLWPVVKEEFPALIEAVEAELQRNTTRPQ